MFRFAEPRRARRPSLTPMVDVVFLLLVFFMLASRFGVDQTIALAPLGTGAAYSGPPRLVEIAPDVLRLNGVAITEAQLIEELGRLTETLSDTIVLRPAGGADVQRVVALMDRLQTAGFTTLSLIEAR
jgi:biopolymer transport protein ExbD